MESIAKKMKNIHNDCKLMDIGCSAWKELYQGVERVILLNVKYEIFIPVKVNIKENLPK